ncbi:NUDIX hydrolase [Micropruina sp.]|uniref:NUDIX hydrolase n=1 Tax=Micropruina sp. TaxID=2737536 RepID=UPI0039E4881D
MVKRMSQLSIAVVRRGRQVLLVQEHLEDGGPLAWSLPGGGVKEGETFVAALARELEEEAGLEMLAVNRLAFVVNSSSPTHPSAVAIAFEVECHEASTPSPRDSDIVAAEFMDVDDAIDRIARVASIVQRDPIVGYLSGAAVPGTIWTFHTRDDGVEELVGRF